MQFKQLGVNFSRRGAGIVADDLSDVLLQHFLVSAFVQNHLVDGFQDDVVQQLLIDCFGPASDAGVGQAAFAAPYDGFAASIVPVDAPEHFIAFAAEDELGKAVIAAVAALASIGAGMHHSPAHQFFLHLHEDFLWNNRIMITFHIVLWNSAIIFDSGFAEKVGGIGLLQQGVTDVFLISQNFVNGARPPLGLSCAGENAVSHKPVGNFVHAVAFQVFPVNALYRFGLLWVNDKIAIGILGVAEEAIMINSHLVVL